VLHGGTFENNSRPMTNTGYITGCGILRTGDLTNDGHVGVGAGDMDVIGPVTNNGTIAVQSTATLTFYGSVDGPGSFPGSGTVVFLADYSPGASPAEVSFDGNVSLEAAARLIVELGGTESGTQYDAIDVADTLLLGGMLDVRLIDGFVPAAGNTFDILDWSALGGTFDSVLLPELPGNLGWDTDDLYVSGELSVESAEQIPGDTDGNDRVDETDLATLADNWGQSGGWAEGDFTGDGLVGPADAAILAANWGYGTGEQTGSSVPEPSTPVLLLALLLTLSYSRRRLA